MKVLVFLAFIVSIANAVPSQEMDADRYSALFDVGAYRRNLFAKVKKNYPPPAAVRTYSKKSYLPSVRRSKVVSKKTAVPVCNGKSCPRYLFAKKKPTYVRTYSKKSYVPVTKKVVTPIVNKKTAVPVCAEKGCPRWLAAKKPTYGYGKYRPVVRTYSKKAPRPVVSKKGYTPVVSKKSHTPVVAKKAYSPVASKNVYRPIHRPCSSHDKHCLRSLFAKKKYPAPTRTYTKKSYVPTVSKNVVRPIVNKKAKSPVCVGKSCYRVLAEKKPTYGYGKHRPVVRTYSKKVPRPVVSKKAPVSKKAYAPVMNKRVYTPVVNKKTYPPVVSKNVYRPIHRPCSAHDKHCSRYLFAKKKPVYGYGKYPAPARTYSKKSYVPAPVVSKKTVPVCAEKGCPRWLAAKKPTYGYGKYRPVVRTYSKKVPRPVVSKKAPVVGKRAYTPVRAYTKKSYVPVVSKKAWRPVVHKAPLCKGKGCSH